VTFDTRNLPEKPVLNHPLWLEALPPHTVENIGDAEFNLIIVEVKDAAR